MDEYQNCTKNPALAESLAQHLFSRITSKWGVQTLVILRKDELRFSQLKKHLHTITDRMLIKTLHELETDGLIFRNYSGTENQKVFYRLSPEGHELAALLQPLTDWINNYALIKLDTP